MKYSWNKKHRFLHEISDDIFQLLDYLKSEDNGKYLYRGQNRAYGDVTRQVPGIYRSCKSIEEAVFYRKRSQLQAAWLFDQVRLIPPSSKWKLLPLYLGNLNEPNNLAAVLAIAQHYGIATDYIDLTNLGPSAIFATQEWKPIAYARKYFSGHIFPIEGDDLGFIYRYNMESLNSYGIIVGDISTGFFGARPLLHEGKVISIDFNQDIEMFKEGIYEVFPFFHNDTPYQYVRPEKVPFSTFDPYIDALVTDSIMDCTPGYLSMQDFIFPSFYFGPNLLSLPTINGGFFLPKKNLDHTPDPYMYFGLLIESGIPNDLTRHEDYAKKIFGKYYGQSMSLVERKIIETWKIV